MRDIAKNNHSKKAEEKRAQTRSLHHAAAEAQDRSRGRIRESSLLDSKRVVYSGQEPRGRALAAPAALARTQSAPARPSLSLHEALLSRTSKSHPNRYEQQKWIIFRRNSIKILAPYFPGSTGNS